MLGEERAGASALEMNFDRFRAPFNRFDSFTYGSIQYLNPMAKLAGPQERTCWSIPATTLEVTEPVGLYPRTKCQPDSSSRFRVTDTKCFKFNDGVCTCGRASLPRF